jgi:hypothetical protein
MDYGAHDSLVPPVQPSPEIDTTVAHSARVQDYWLGGQDNYPADRETGDLLVQAAPGLARSVRESRYFLARAVRYLANQGIRQFLDIGAGLPCLENTHEIAQRADPRSRVVYADNDPLAAMYGRVLLTSGPGGSCDSIQADVRDPGDILAGAARTLDLTEPVALLMLGVLDYIPDTGEAQAVVRRLLEVVPAGSYLAVSCLTAGVDAEAVTRAVRLWNDSGCAPLTLRGPAELGRFFDGLDLVMPGIVSCPRWQPENTPFGEPAAVPHFCGAARKPGSA